jgi:chromosome segregation ATPase
LLPAPVVQALVYAVVFALGGGLLGLQLHAAKKLSAALEHSGQVESDLAKAVGDSVSSTYTGIADKLKSSHDALEKLTGKLESSIGSHSASLENTVLSLTSKLDDTYTSGTDELKSALSVHAGSMKEAGGGWSKEILSSFRQHSVMIQSGVDALTQLDETLRTNLEKALKANTDRLEKALKANTEQVEKALQGHTDRAEKSLQGHTDRAEKALQGHTEREDASLQGHTERAEKALQGHTDRIAATTQALAESLSAIGDLGKNIEKMLHIQEAIDGTLDTMMKTDEFQKTIARLSDHLEKSDELLKLAIRPRQIQLVEARVDSDTA